MEGTKAFILPGVAALVLVAYFVYRSTLEPAPEATASASATKAPPSPASGPAGEPASTPRPTPAEAAPSEPPARAPAETGAAPGTPTARDRAQRDALAERLARAQRQRLARGDDEPIPPEALGRLNKDYIQQRVKDDLLPLAKECYDNALEDDTELAGRLVMNFRIVGEPDVGGIVEEVQLAEGSEITHADMIECMRESMMSMTFHPPENGGMVEVTYPFVFVTED